MGSLFFNTLMSKPFGLMQYVGAWLTQFMYKPAVGASILSFIWILIYLVGVKAFRLKGSASALMLLPIACLLTSVVDLGYWVYIYTIRGYWFSQSVSYLAVLTLLWVARCTPRRWHLVWYMAGACLYPFVGWFALLFILCLALSDKVTWRELICLVLLVLTAKIWGTLLYSNLKTEDVIFAGFPRFVTPSDKTDSLSIPFLLIGVISILITLIGRYSTKWFVPIISVVAGVVFTWSMMFQDKNYVNEMRMVRSAEENNWKDVLNVYENAEEPTVSMVMLKNLALMNEGGLLDRSFKMGNDFTNIYNPDSVSVSFLEIASPVAYYNYGLVNEGFRLSFECAVQEGFSPCYLKMLARCANANGEQALVDRYTAQLQGHPYLSDWKPAPVTKNILELKTCYPDELTGVENSDSYLINSISLWYDSDSKVASEQALFFSILRCDSKRFWASLRNYVKNHMDEEFPLHAQEAYIMFMDKAPEEKRMMLPVSQETYDRYKKFWVDLENYAKTGMSLNDVKEKMRDEFGDTYWYYNIFARKIFIRNNVFRADGNKS